MITYMRFTDIANYLNVTKGALAHYNLPEPDAMVGKARGWKRENIEAWNASRPGHGGRPYSRECDQ